MGLFDEVKCGYPLPGNPPSWAQDAHFQTKDLTCVMMDYTITADGRLIEDSGKENHETTTATIEIYTSNIVGSGPGIYTANGEDAVTLTYQVVFVDGKVFRLTESEHTVEPAAKRKAYAYPALSDQDRQAASDRDAESLLGKTIYVWWGGQKSGYEAKVVAENKRQIVAENDKGEFETIHRSSRDCTFFDCYEDGLKYKEERKQKWDDERREFEGEIAARQEIA